MSAVSEALSSDQIVSRLRDAGSDPVFIQRDGQVAAVLMSAERYQLMQKVVARAFNRLCEEVSRKAQGEGLTEEILAEILAEIKAEP